MNEKLQIKMFIPSSLVEETLNEDYTNIKFEIKQSDTFYDLNSVATIIAYLIGASGISKVIVAALENRKNRKIKIKYRKEIGELTIDAENADKDSIKELISTLNKIIEK